MTYMNDILVKILTEGAFGGFLSFTSENFRVLNLQDS